MKLKLKKKPSKHSDRRTLLSGGDGGYDDVSSSSEESEPDYGYGSYTSRQRNDELDGMSRRPVPRRGSLGKMVTRSAEGLQAMKQSLMATTQQRNQTAKTYGEMDDGEFSDGSFELKINDEDDNKPPPTSSRSISSRNSSRKGDSSRNNSRKGSTRRTKSNDDRLLHMRNGLRMYDRRAQVEFQAPVEFKPYQRKLSPKRRNNNYHNDSDHDDDDQQSYLKQSGRSIASYRSTGTSSSRSPKRSPRRLGSRSISTSRSPKRDGGGGSRSTKRRGSLQFLSKSKEALDMIYYDGDDTASAAGQTVKSHKSSRSRGTVRSKSHDEALRDMQRTLSKQQRDGDKGKSRKKQDGGILTRGLAALENLYDDSLNY